MNPLRLFDPLSPKARQVLLAQAVERRFAQDEVLFTAGSPSRGFYVVLDGEVRVLRGRGGRQHVVHVEGKGGTLGEVALFDGGGYPAAAIAAAPTRCLVFTRAAIEAALAADPEVAWFFLRRFATRMRHLIERLDRLAAQSVTSRLAGYLLARARTAETTEVSLGRTQTEIAEELGTVREVLVRSLRFLREEEIIAWTGRGRYRIVDTARLKALAEVPRR